MSKIASLLGRRPTLVTDHQDRPVAQDLEPAALELVSEMSEIAAAPPEKPADKPMLELDQELFFPIASQLGEENEAVRNLLIDAEHKMSELDGIKRSIGRLVDPVSKTLRAYEETKSEKLSLQNVLNHTRTAHAKLRDDFALAEKRAAALHAECGRLRDVLTVAQQNVAALENTKAEQSAHLNAQRSQLADLQQHLQQQSTDLQIARDESRRFAERIALADRRVVQLEADSDAARQRFLLAEQERGAVQAMLDKSLNDASQMSRKLLDTENALQTAQARLRRLETAFEETHAERLRLAAALDEATEAHRAESHAQNVRFEALQARSQMSDKLLEEARQTLVARAEEINSHERRVADAALSRTSVESKLCQVELALDDRDARIKELEHKQAALLAQNTELARAVAARENAHSRAREQLQSQDGQLQRLQAQIRADQESMDMRTEELHAQLQRERLERTMAEGALEAGRKDIARLLRELAALQYRSDAGHDASAIVSEALVRFKNAA
jgi:chromosome segregation ATPase